MLITIGYITIMSPLSLCQYFPHKLQKRRFSGDVRQPG